MGVAVHGYWCRSRTFPLTCRYCGDEVYLLTCNCGSKVFFDSLGDPWPIHDCAERPGSLSYAVAQFGKAWVEKALATRMMQAGWRRNNGMEAQYASRVQTRQQQKVQPNEILKKVPTLQKKISDIGRIREILVDPNVLKHVHLEQGSLGARFVEAKIPNQRICQMTIHVGDLSEDDLSSYTALAAFDLIECGIFRVGHLVSFVLEGIRIPGRDGLWLVKNIQHID